MSFTLGYRALSERQASAISHRRREKRNGFIGSIAVSFCRPSRQSRIYFVLVYALPLPAADVLPSVQ